MIVTFSFADIPKMIPQFKQVSEFELLLEDVSKEVLPYLYHLGANIDKPYYIQACKHRDNSLREHVGYRYVFLERSDKEWLNSKRCSMSARIHAQEDKWLAADMVRMSAEGMGESAFKAMCAAIAGSDGTTKTRVLKKELMEDHERVTQDILSLQHIQRSMRGYLHEDEDIFIV